METVYKDKNNVLAANISFLRKQLKLSQAAFGKYFDEKRDFVLRLESGKQSIPASFIYDVSSKFSVPIEDLYSKEFPEKLTKYSEKSLNNEIEERNPVPDFNIDKFINVLLFLIESAQDIKEHTPKHFLNLMYLIDYDYYEIYETHLSTMRYKKNDSGVIMDDFFKIFTTLLEKNYLHQLNLENFKKYIVLKKADKGKILLQEAELIKTVIRKFKNYSEDDLNECINGDMPVQATDTGDNIDYELVFYRQAPYSVRVYEDDE